jgi:hypothetical protein
MAALLHHTARAGAPPPDQPRTRRWTGLAYAAVLLASLLSLALQTGPGDGALPDEPLLSLAAWASATADWAVGLGGTTDRSGVER